MQYIGKESFILSTNAEKSYFAKFEEGKYFLDYKKYEEDLKKLKLGVKEQEDQFVVLKVKIKDNYLKKKQINRKSYALKIHWCKERLDLKAKVEHALDV